MTSKALRELPVVPSPSFSQGRWILFASFDEIRMWPNPHFQAWRLQLVCGFQCLCHQLRFLILFLSIFFSEFWFCFFLRAKRFPTTKAPSMPRSLNLWKCPSASRKALQWWGKTGRSLRRTSHFPLHRAPQRGKVEALFVCLHCCISSCISGYARTALTLWFCLG